MNNRVIKFRFFDGKRMCEVGDLTFFADNAGYHINGEFPSTGKDPYPLMQFTGLLDKSGKEIYEGDVIESGGSKKLRYEIRWNEKSALFSACKTEGHFPYAISSLANIEVISNIYESPDLLPANQKGHD